MLGVKNVLVDGVYLKAPLSYVVPEKIGDCCGAGEGWGEMLVPETILGLRISAACHIHDHSWEVATEEDFDQTNEMFLHNIMAIIRAKSANGLMRWLRNYRATTYYNSVQEVGRGIFFAMKAAKRRTREILSRQAA